MSEAGYSFPYMRVEKQRRVRAKTCLVVFTEGIAMDRRMVSSFAALGVVGLLSTSAQAIALVSFDFPQTVIRGLPSSAPAGVNTGTVSDPSILGGHRDVSARITGFQGNKTRGYIVANINANPMDSENLLESTLDRAVYGVTTVIWDGSPLFSGDTAGGNFATPAAFNLGGASGLDITAGFGDRFEVVTFSDIPNVGDVRIGLWDKNGYFAELSKPLAGGNTFVAQEFLYLDFVLSNPLFDFTRIGAIGLQIDGRLTATGGSQVAGLDASVDEIRIGKAIPEPMTAGLGLLSLGALGAFATRRRQA